MQRIMPVSELFYCAVSCIKILLSLQGTMVPSVTDKYIHTHVHMWPLQPLLLTETNILLCYLTMIWHSIVWSSRCSSMEARSSTVAVPYLSTSVHAVISQLVGLQGARRWDRTTVDGWPITVVQASQSTVTWTTWAWCPCKLSCVSVWASTWKESHNLRTLSNSVLKMFLCNTGILAKHYMAQPKRPSFLVISRY